MDKAEALRRAGEESSKRATARGEVAFRSGTLRSAVVVARDEGATVQEIADAIGLSRPGVYELMKSHA